MKMSKVTTIFILVAIVLIAIFDVYVISKGGVDASISWWFWEKSAGNCSENKPAMPLVPLLWGIITGHLFWQMKNRGMGKASK